VESNDKPKKTTTTKKSEKIVEEAVDVPVAPVPAAKKSVAKTPAKTAADGKSSSTKSSGKEKKERKEKTVVPPPTEDSKKEEEAVVAGEVVSKKRREVSHESVSSEFEGLLELLRENIEQSRSAAGKKTSNVKLLRQLGKRLKVLRADCMRISKQRRTNRKNNTSSGFMKPVKVSDEMAKFAGWDANQLKSRIEATKYICQYIKDNNLQDPADKRRINPDGKLTKLLGYTPTPESPLFYYTIQQKIQKHFKNPDAVAVAK
jgi:chromatin remodeling complex protein RSC6